MEIGSFSPIHLAWLDAFVRILTSILCALAIGVERVAHKKPVDFRPFVIISLASCALSIAIVELGYRSTDPHLTIDPAKVMSGVMSGIGFLGAGALFRERHYVQGAGSAAAIWSAGAIGIVCGLGFIWLAGMLAALIVLILLIGRHFVGKYTVSQDDMDR